MHSEDYYMLYLHALLYRYLVTFHSNNGIQDLSVKMFNLLWFVVYDNCLLEILYYVDIFSTCVS